LLADKLLPSIQQYLRDTAAAASASRPDTPAANAGVAEAHSRV
jgi:hypothetical protein